MNRQKIAGRFTRAVGKKYAGPLGPIIDQLLAFLMRFLSDACPAKDIKDIAKNHPAFVILKLTQQSIRDGHSRRDAKVFAQAGLETILASSAVDLGG